MIIILEQFRLLVNEVIIAPEQDDAICWYGLIRYLASSISMSMSLLTAVLSIIFTFTRISSINHTAVSNSFISLYTFLHRLWWSTNFITFDRITFNENTKMSASKEVKTSCLLTSPIKNVFDDVIAFFSLIYLCLFTTENNIPTLFLSVLSNRIVLVANTAVIER